MEFTITGYVREYTQGFQLHSIIPDAIITLIYDFYLPIITLKFKDHPMTDNLSLSDDNKLVTHNSECDYSYIHADVDPIMTGIHCFRVLAHSKNMNTILFAFIQPKDKYPEYSYSDSTCWGSTTHGFTYSGGDDNEQGDGLELPSEQYQLDMMIDCENGEIKIGFVKDWSHQSGQERQEVILNGLPSNNPNGWMPHFNIYDKNASLRILQIDPSLYRIHSLFADELFGI